ncbi:MAG: pyridoxal phosphate-dependent aminotransferase [Dehalococcoidales bacterium]|jgi:cystathionine beta-lyase|nr:pyridoxal phosphate-dependent aminotransferase [Dehalococcoidales bacterium]
MKYDFDQICDRRNTNCAKWDGVKAIFGREDIIPMWVADMDFPVATPIVEALKKRAEHPFYGYTQVGQGIIESVVERMERKFNWKIQPEWVVLTPGVVPALNVAIRSVSHAGDEIILQPPVYYPFFPAVTGSGCQIVYNPLKLVNGQYEIDFTDLEKRFHTRAGMHPVASRIKAIVLCNPQNPVGRLWSKEELIRLGEIAIRHGAIVISDEIHCEILFKGYRHIPFAAISEEFAANSIVCMAPSKTFSLAGLEASSIIIPDKRLRDNFNNIRAGILPGPNLFGLTALEAAYRYGDEWLEQVLDYLQANLDFLLDYFEKKIPEIKVIKPQGTYLVWLDCRGLGFDDMGLRAFMREKARLGLDDGFLFGPGGSGFQRMNIACPRSILEEALNRLEAAVKELRRPLG